jgi:hypothetical protein
MKQLIVFLLLSFAAQVTAQNGIVALARYDGVNLPSLRSDATLPEYMGGLDSLKSHFTQYFNYINRQVAEVLVLKKPREGLIAFAVNDSGQIVHFQVLDSIALAVDLEALRTLQKLAKNFYPNPTQRFAIAYDPFPEWQWQAEKRREEVAKHQILKENAPKLPADSLLPYVDPKRACYISTFWLGETTPIYPLSKNLSLMMQIGYSGEIISDKWVIGGSLQMRWGRYRRDFFFEDLLAVRGMDAGMVGASGYMGWQFKPRQKLVIMPFLGLEMQSYNIAYGYVDNYRTYFETAWSAPSGGILLDFALRQKGSYNRGVYRLHTTNLRVRLAAHWVHFADERRGTLIDLGIGIGRFQRRLNR